MPREDKRLLININAQDTELEEEAEAAKKQTEKFLNKLSEKLKPDDNVSVKIVLKNLILKPSFWKEVELVTGAELRLFGELTEKGLKKNVSYLNDKDIDSFDINDWVYGSPNLLQLTEAKAKENNFIDNVLKWLIELKNGKKIEEKELVSKFSKWLEEVNLNKLEESDQLEIKNALGTFLKLDFRNLSPKDKDQINKIISWLKKFKKPGQSELTYSKYTFVPINRIIFSSTNVSTSAPSLHMRFFIKEIDQILQGTDRTRLEQVFSNSDSQTDILVNKNVLTKATGKKWHDYLALLYGVFEIFTEIYNVMNYDDDVLSHNFILQRDSWYSPRHDLYISKFDSEVAKELKNILKEKHQFRNENGKWFPLFTKEKELEFFVPTGKNVMAVSHLISIESHTCFAQIEIEVGKNDLESTK